MPKEKKPLVRKNGVQVTKPTSRGTWKKFERDIANFFGTKRTPLSGINSGHDTNSDSLHPTIYIEAKYRNSFSIFSLFLDTEEKAKRENKVPVVAIKQKGEQGYLLVIRPEHLRKLNLLKNEHITNTADEGENP